MLARLVEGKEFPRKPLLTVIKNDYSTSTSEILQKLDTLLIIFVLDFVVVREGSVLCGRFDELEPCPVQAVLVLLTPHVLNNHVVLFPCKVRRVYPGDRVSVDVPKGARPVCRSDEVGEGGGSG